MRKIYILTSVLALAACGGGSGGGGGSHGGSYVPPAQPTTPSLTTPNALTITVQEFDGGTTVTQGNESVTNMSSYTLDYGVDENQTRINIINYVKGKLAQTSSRGGLLNRAATARAQQMQSRNGQEEFDPEQFAAADLYIKNMKQVLYEMTQKSGEDLTTYVEGNKENVVNALKLQNQNVSEDTETADLITAFGALGLTSENIVQKMEEFDTARGISKVTMDNVKLRDTGYDAYFAFGLDAGGVIQSVALFENKTGEYGSAYPDKQIIASGNGAAAAYWDGSFEYKNNDAGWLDRGGSGHETEFSSTVYMYTFDLGNHNAHVYNPNNPEEEIMVEDQNHNTIPLTQAIIPAGKFSSVEVIGAQGLTLPQAKEKIKEYIIGKVNNILHSQPADANPYTLDAIVAVANYYISSLNELVTAMPESPVAIQQVATMNGMGKDVNLQYADFGYSKLTRTSSEGGETNYLTYAGGYDQRRMDKTPGENHLENGATFTGTAVISVEDEDKRPGSQNKSNNVKTLASALYKDTDAHLTYNHSGNTVSHTLRMNNLTLQEATLDGASLDVGTNTNWYTVVVTDTEGSNNVTYQFDETNKNIDDHFKFFAVANNGDITRTQGLIATNGTDVIDIDKTDGTLLCGENCQYKAHGDASVEYYGADKTRPTEATAGFWMDERYHNDTLNIDHEVSVYGVFGGTKDTTPPTE